MKRGRKTQRLIILKRFRDNDGKVSRNWAIREMFITRLSAIIKNLRQEGYEIKGGYVNIGHGRDFIYTLLDSPEGSITNPIEHERVIVDGQPMMRRKDKPKPQVEGLGL